MVEVVAQLSPQVATCVTVECEGLKMCAVFCFCYCFFLSLCAVTIWSTPWISLALVQWGHSVLISHLGE